MSSTFDFDKFVENAFDYKEALTRQGITQDDVDLLRQKAKRSKLVPRFINDKQLVLFSNAGKGDIERSSKWLHVYYKMKLNSPEFFAKRDVYSEGVQNALKNQINLMLPVYDGCNVLLHKIKNCEPKAYVFDDAIKTFIMMAEACTFINGPRDGTIFLYDLKDVVFRHLMQPSISSMKKGMDFVQSGSPLNITAIHVFNSTLLMSFIFTMIKPFLKKEFYDRIHLHKAGESLEDFFKNHIPRSHIPSDYGGDLESCDTLNEKTKEILNEMREYFLFEEQQMNLKLEHNADDNNNVDDDDDDFQDAEDE